MQRLPAGSAAGLSRSAPGSVSSHQVHIYDLDRPSTLPVELTNHYAVIYTVPPALGTETDDRLDHLLRQLSPLPGRFVYISTTGVYGDCGGAVVTEEHEPRPATDRGRRRLAAETLLRRWCDKHKVDLVILRVPGIYGPGRLGLEGIRERMPVLLEADANPGNRIHVSDLVSCCVAAVSAVIPAGIYNVGDGDFRTSTWFAHEVARQFDLPPAPEISRAQAEQQFSPMRLSFLSESRRIDTRKMKTILGVAPLYANAADGIRASLREQGTKAS